MVQYLLEQRADIDASENGERYGTTKYLISVVAILMFCFEQHTGRFSKGSSANAQLYGIAKDNCKYVQKRGGIQN